MKLLANASVAAFLGAFFAFILVALNDWRRRKRSKRQIRYLISDSADHARAKLRTVENFLEMLKENKCVPAPIMKFPLDALRQKQLEVIDLLNANEQQALTGLLYWMEGIDGLLEDYLQTGKALRRAVESNADNATRTQLAKHMMDNLDDAKRNLEYLINMCEWYVTGRAHKILEMQHPIPSGD